MLLLPQQSQFRTANSGDWLTVFTYIEQHPGMGQGDIIEIFWMQKEGALIFTQSNLSQIIQDMEQLNTKTWRSRISGSRSC